jgi:hypothetical protein
MADGNFDPMLAPSLPAASLKVFDLEQHCHRLPRALR